MPVNAQQVMAEIQRRGLNGASGFAASNTGVTPEMVQAEIQRRGIQPITDSEIGQIDAVRDAEEAAVQQQSMEQARADALRKQAEQLSPLEALAIQMGGSATKLFAGVEQLALENAPSLFGISEEEARERIKKIEKEQAFAREILAPVSEAQPVASFAGEVAGQSFIPGAAGKTILSRIIGGALVAGGTEALQFTPEEESRMDNALRAAGFGAGFAGITEAAKPLVKGFVNSVKGRITGDDINDLVAAGQKAGIDVLPADISTSPATRELVQAAEKVPVIGTAGSRLKQAAQQKAAAKELLDRFAKKAGDIDQVEDEVLSGLKRGVADKKQQARKLFTDVAETMDDKGPIRKDRMRAAVREIIADEERLGGAADKALIQKLSGFVPDDDFSTTRKLRSRIGAEITKAYRGEGSVTGSESAAKLMRVKSALEEDINNFVKQTGTQKGQAQWRRANEFYVNNLTPFKKGALKRVIDQDDPKAALTFLKGAGAEGGQKRAKQLFNSLDDKGRRAVRAGLLQEAFEAGLPEPGQQGIFSANKFSTYLDKNENLISNFFTAQDKEAIKGLKKVMRATARAGQIAENPPTGARLLLPSLAGAAVIDPNLAAAAGGGALLARMTFANPRFAKLFAAAGKAPVESKAFNDIYRRIEAQLSPQIGRELSEREELE